MHTFRPAVLLTVSPFYHFNRADFAGGAGDTPVIPTDNRASNYVGAQTTLGAVAGKHNARVGFESFAQHDSARFGIQDTAGGGLALSQREAIWGILQAAFLEDHYKAAPWLTFNAGIRLTRFSGALAETSADPRVGAAIRLPKLNWVLRGYYGRYYQAPPLDTVSGPLRRVSVSYRCTGSAMSNANSA